MLLHVCVLGNFRLSVVSKVLKCRSVVSILTTSVHVHGSSGCQGASARGVLWLFIISHGVQDGCTCILS